MKYPKTAKWVYIDFDELEQATGETLSKISLKIGHSHDWFGRARREKRPILLMDVRNIQELYNYTARVIPRPKEYEPKRVRVAEVSKKQEQEQSAIPLESVKGVSDNMAMLWAVNEKVTQYLERQAPPNGYDESHIVNAILTAVRIMLAGVI